MAHPDGCEAILWREGSRRCELWTVDGIGILKVFDGEALIYQELRTRVVSCYQRAQELREVRRGETHEIDWP